MPLSSHVLVVLLLLFLLLSSRYKGSSIFYLKFHNLLSFSCINILCYTVLLPDIKFGVISCGRMHWIRILNFHVIFPFCQCLKWDLPSFNLSLDYSLFANILCLILHFRTHCLPSTHTHKSISFQRF